MPKLGPVSVGKLQLQHPRHGQWDACYCSIPITSYIVLLWWQVLLPTYKERHLPFKTQRVTVHLLWGKGRRMNGNMIQSKSDPRASYLEQAVLSYIKQIYRWDGNCLYWPSAPATLLKLQKAKAATGRMKDHHSSKRSGSRTFKEPESVQVHGTCRDASVGPERTSRWSG